MREDFDRVVHVSDETHAAVMTFCREHNLAAAHWVSALILAAAKRTTEAPRHADKRPRADERFESLLSAWGQGVRKQG